MTRFVLVHGAWHGAWCWERVAEALDAQRRQVCAVDLPGHGARAHEQAATLDEYVAPLVASIRAGDVLVGHSMGGAVVTAAAERARDRVAAVVYLAAWVPSDGESVLETTRSVVTPGEGEVVVDERGRLVVASFEAARRFLYHDCDPVLARAAFERLVPQVVAPLAERIALPRLTAMPPRYGYVSCRDDRAIPVAYQRAAAARLGVAPLELPTAHSPFLNEPARVAAALCTVAEAPTTPGPEAG